MSCETSYVVVSRDCVFGVESCYDVVGRYDAETERQMLQALLILTGCITVEPPNNPLAIDDDGDGYTEFEGDCDDRDPDTFPGSVTEATSNECMKDSDGDGFGDVDASGEFDVGTDCDDLNPQRFPGSAENESDSECLIDEDEDGWSAEVGDCDDSIPHRNQRMNCGLQVYEM
jgi:hypothetical protein